MKLQFRTMNGVWKQEKHGIRSESYNSNSKGIVKIFKIVNIIWKVVLG